MGRCPVTQPISGTSPVGGGGGGGGGAAATSRVGLQFSDSGNRGPGSSLRSGGDLFGNLTPGSAIGQASTAGTIREVAWRRTTTPAGSFRISIIDSARTERAFVLVTAAAAAVSGSVSGLSLGVLANEQIAVLWDLTSTGTTQDPAVTVYVEPS